MRVQGGGAMIERLRFRLAMWLSPYDALAYRLHVRGLDFVEQPPNLAIIECHIGPSEHVPWSNGERVAFHSTGGSLTVDGAKVGEGIRPFDLKDTDLSAKNIELQPRGNAKITSWLRWSRYWPF